MERYNGNLGADPEFFFEKGGKIYESSIALPDGGIDDTAHGTIIRDGFQGEFNPSPSKCRQSLMWNIIWATRAVRDLGYTPVLGAGYWIPETDFANLSDDSKVFGCIPSENIYGSKRIDVNPRKYMFRPAGGHIHLEIPQKLQGREPELVRLLDIFVGNTCVAFDQDPLAIERRKNYGRAGEFRVKPYGLEYRTLSNFWLGNYLYHSLVFGLARQAISIMAYSDDAPKIINLFEKGIIAKAINSNNKELAIENFKKLESYIKENFTVEYDDYKDPINLETFTLSEMTFDHMLKNMSRGFKGLEIGVDHWEHILENDYLGNGIESTLLLEDKKWCKFIQENEIY